MKNDFFFDNLQKVFGRYIGYLFVFVLFDSIQQRLVTFVDEKRYSAEITDQTLLQCSNQQVFLLSTLHLVNIRVYFLASIIMRENRIILMRVFLVAGVRSKPLKNSFNSLESSKLSLLSDIFGCWEKNENEFFILR